MSYRVGTKGQIVIPKAVRDDLGLSAGTEVEIVQHDDQVVVRRARSAIPVLGGRYSRSGMADRLLADRRSEPR